MVGGVLTSFIGELVVYPSLYFIWRSRSLRRSPLFPQPATVAGGDEEIAGSASQAG